MLNTSAKILVVDDMASLCEMQRMILVELGYNNVTVTSSVFNAKEHLRKARVDGTPFHLLLSDINMPGENGLELLKWVRASDMSSMPVIMVSSMGDLDHVMQAAELGATSFIVKPISKESVQAKLSKLK